jgi:hypothetical protein
MEAIRIPMNPMQRTSIQTRLADARSAHSATFSAFAGDARLGRHAGTVHAGTAHARPRGGFAQAAFAQIVSGPVSVWSLCAGVPNGERPAP